MDYVKPQDIAGSMVAAGASKVNLPIKHLLIRGALAGAYLGVATSMAVGAALQTGQPIVGALVFPFGLCLVILLGTELITGSFALLPCATVAGKPGADMEIVITGLPLPRAGRVGRAWLEILGLNRVGRKIIVVLDDLAAIALCNHGSVPDCACHRSSFESVRRGPYQKLKHIDGPARVCCFGHRFSESCRINCATKQVRVPATAW